MQPARWIKNTLFAFILLLIIASVDRAGLPMTQRVEEYIAFVLTTDFTHEALSEQARQVGNFGGNFRLSDVLSGAADRLRQSVLGGGGGAALVDGPLGSAEEAGTPANR